MNLIKHARLIFWDFDGVIKESIEAKTLAFVQLFEPFGSEIVEKVRQHHLDNGGMSRFEKIPLYLKWANEDQSIKSINKYCNKFSKNVFDGVVNSPWVAGVEDYLRNNSHNQVFILVSATPQNELEKILSVLELGKIFDTIFGAPIHKSDAIHKILNSHKIKSKECLMIGDAQADFDAAKANQVPFLLRRHITNNDVFENYQGKSIKDFASQ